MGAEEHQASGGRNFDIVTASGWHPKREAFAAEGSKEGLRESGEGREMIGRLRVMVADDVQLILDGVVHSLETFGVNVVHTACDGEEALSMLVKHADEIDLLFTDIRMPKMLGDQVVLKFRDHEARYRKGKPRVCIYAMSGDASASITQVPRAWRSDLY